MAPPCAGRCPLGPLPRFPVPHSPIRGMDDPTLPHMVTPPPGPATRELARRLRQVESRNVTYLSEHFPVFWARARGAVVDDADGNRYLDLTGAFGVALAGHAHPRITAAIREQAGILTHGMGDVHPPVRKVEFLERLAAILPWGSHSRITLANSGSEAVEIALKTTLLATGRPGVVAFRGAYHGLTLGSLAATGRDDFREPFRGRLYPGVRFVPFPTTPDEARESLAALDLALAGGRREFGGTDAGAAGPGEGGLPGAVILEPIQGRAGVRVPPPGFLAEVARRTRAAGALLVFDEIFSGLGRTGRLFALEHEGVVPDLICVGKGLGGGLPLSACAGPVEVMDAWPESPGEALHTSTFLGHPLACTAGLTFLDVLEEEELTAYAAREGEAFRRALARELPEASIREIRGRGFFIGIDLGRPGAGVEVTEEALRRGLIVLPAGPHGEVVELSPPLILSGRQREVALELLVESFRRSVG
ncbi:MAG: aminotransferase class III-fold pyridoxal phosphate-dependent enzyme [Gemmatimonadales bacterium]|nr:MAG: aminotransferase class III-fold pyridoxal phosphate-dependent enzyme [Gemmatimonadales bacterium]